MLSIMGSWDCLHVLRRVFRMLSVTCAFVCNNKTYNKIRFDVVVRYLYSFFLTNSSARYIWNFYVLHVVLDRPHEPQMLTHDWSIQMKIRNFMSFSTALHSASQSVTAKLPLMLWTTQRQTACMTLRRCCAVQSSAVWCAMYWQLPYAIRRSLFQCIA